MHGKGLKAFRSVPSPAYSSKLPVRFWWFRFVKYPVREISGSCGSWNFRFVRFGSRGSVTVRIKLYNIRCIYFKSPDLGLYIPAGAFFSPHKSGSGPLHSRRGFFFLKSQVLGLYIPAGAFFLKMSGSGPLHSRRGFFSPQKSGSGPLHSRRGFFSPPKSGSGPLHSRRGFFFSQNVDFS